MRESRRLVDALHQPACYPHPVQAVELRETHISWVLLTGRYAYKIKKPVQLPFLDFSTLELRRHFCEEELRLNKRFAPSLYLDVVPISGTSELPQVGAIRAGPAQGISEYAVQLRQFSPEEELTRRLSEDALEAQDFAHLGSLLADIHETAERCDPQTAFGRAERAIQDVTDTCDELDGLATDERKPQLDGLRAQMAERGKALADLIEARRNSGFVRECHGDLHAGNIVRVDGALTPFDCIEFDPGLRRIDVMNDTAFLVMDLLARGRPAFAYTFLNAWLERNGDYAALQLLRYFCAYRAMVRAKVNLLRGGESTATRPSADEYLALAEALVERRRPRLLLTCGLSGSGKTWLSALLLACMPAIRVRSDVERKRLAGLAAGESSASKPGGGIYTLEFNARTYARLRQLAALALQAGEHAIVDAAFLRRAERADFIALARECNAEIVIVHCTAPRAVLEQRILDRARNKSDASEATTEVLGRQLGYWEPFDEAEREHVVETDTANPSAIETLIAGFGAREDT